VESGEGIERHPVATCDPVGLDAGGIR